MINNYILDRKEYFLHFTKSIPCSFEITTKLNITSFLNTIKRNKLPFYGSFIYMLSSVINEFDYFKFELLRDIDDINEENFKASIKMIDKIHPAFTLFNDENKNFYTTFLEFNDSFLTFIDNYRLEVMNSKNHTKLCYKIPPKNSFNISALPWVKFENFSLHLPKNRDYFMPIFTLCKFYKIKNDDFINLSSHFHHAVIDGYGASKIINSLQDKISSFTI